MQHNQSDQLRSDVPLLQQGAAEQKNLLRQLVLEKYEAIAVIGIGLRFPGGASTPAEFMAFLERGESGTVEVPPDRWDSALFDGEGAPLYGAIRSSAGGYLDSISDFDAPFFNISPKEAAYLDPQQRLVLETAWQALEHANVDGTAYRRRSGGVYIGASAIDYALELNTLSNNLVAPQMAAGISHSAISGRLSYFLGWRGPSISVDTACSSSLVALHQAVEGLRRRECEIALCGGVNVIHYAGTSMALSALGALSSDGVCRTFDESADGYGRGEGCGIIVLKRLSDAQRDGDKILALIRGTAVRQDGDSAGLTAPNGHAQEEVMRAALARARLHPQEISYVEAHGTATPLGDPIELESINSVFGVSRKGAELVVGSVKPNIGHLEPAAGIAGVIKCVLQASHGKIFPHINVKKPSSRIPWSTYAIRIPERTEVWTSTPLRAAVNSFGFTGTIATAIVEEFPQTVSDPSIATPDTPGEAIFTLSAKSRSALRRQLQRYRRYTTDNPAEKIADICYTSNVGRAHFDKRVAGIVSNVGELGSFISREAEKLAERTSGSGGETNKVAFLFSGSGTQFLGMGDALYQQFDTFRGHFDECEQAVARELGYSVRPWVLRGDGNPDELNEVGLLQPALFVLEYALAKTWIDWGVRPSAMLGHSFGELAAATVGGLFSLQDGARLAVQRALAVQSIDTPGGMIAIRAAADDVIALLTEYSDVAIAAANSGYQCVVSGETHCLEDVANLCAERGWEVTRLNVQRPMHSPLMRPAADTLRGILNDINFRQPTLTLVSSLTGRVARYSQIATPDYWVAQLLNTVQFHAGMQTIQRRGRHVFVEVGPGSSLLTQGKKCVDDAQEHLWLTSIVKAEPAVGGLLKSVAAVYAAGLNVAWSEFHRGRPVSRVELPLYEFDREHYWLPEIPNSEAAASSHDTVSYGRRRPRVVAQPERTQALDQKPAAAGFDLHAARQAAADSRTPILFDLLRSALANVLHLRHIDDIEPGDRLLDLGVDSVIAVDLRNVLSAAVQSPLDITIVVDHPTVWSMAEFLSARIAAANDSEAPSQSTFSHS